MHRLMTDEQDGLASLSILHVRKARERAPCSIAAVNQQWTRRRRSDPGDGEGSFNGFTCSSAPSCPGLGRSAELSADMQSDHRAGARPGLSQAVPVRLSKADRISAPSLSWHHPDATMKCPCLARSIAQSCEK